MGKCQFVGPKLGIRLDWKKEKVRSGERGESKKTGLTQEPPEGSIKSQDPVYIFKRRLVRGGYLAGQEWTWKVRPLQLRGRDILD